jgi:hypothetical protein
MNAGKSPMRLDQFDDGLLRWGSDLARWPAMERERAEALLAESADARALLAEDRALAGTLAAALAVPIRSEQVVARVQQALAARRERGFWTRLLNPLPLVLGAATAVAIGAAAAILLPVAMGLDPDTLLVTALGGGLI